MSDSELRELFSSIEGQEPTPDFLADLWTDLDAELSLQDQVEPIELAQPSDVTHELGRSPHQWWVGGAVAAVAAAILIVVGFLTLARGGNPDDVITTATPTPTTDLPTAEPEALPTPKGDAVPPPPAGGLIETSLRHTVANPREGDALVLDPLTPGTAYELGQLDGTIVQIPEESDLPAGWAYTPFPDDGRNLDTMIIRDVFVPAPEPESLYPEDYPEVLDGYRTATGRIPDELAAYPLVELVQADSLGQTVEEATAAFVDNNAMEILTGPTPRSLGGAEGLAFEARTTMRAIVVTEPSSLGRNPVHYIYPEGVRLSVHVLETHAGIVVVAVSAEEGRWGAWLPIAEPLVDGLFFAAD
ncbi:MAG: hypothetical protein ACR2PK_05010 [Acidimicrobiales bacterium]